MSPVYEFEDTVTGERVLRRAPMREAGTLHSEMQAQGYRRIYDVQKPIIGITFSEAMELTGNELLAAYEGRGEMVGRPDDYDARAERTPAQKRMAARQKHNLLKTARTY